MSAFYTFEKLRDFGFKTKRDYVRISGKASIYVAHLMTIGYHAWIDDFYNFSTVISIESHIHQGSNCVLYGANGIFKEDYARLFHRFIVFSTTAKFLVTTLSVNSPLQQLHRHKLYESHQPNLYNLAL